MAVVLAPVIGSALAAAFPTLAAYSIAGTALTTIGGQLLAGVALTALSRALGNGSNTAQQVGISTQRTTAGDTVCQTLILGRYATAGNKVCPDMVGGSVGKTPNAYLTYVHDIADIPIDGLDAVWIDDEKVVLGDPLPVGGIYPGHRPVTAGKYKDRAWFQLFDGTQTTAAPGLLAANDPDRPWTTDMIGRGVAYVICRFKADQKVYKGLPTVLFEVRGVRLYDPRRDSTMGGSGTHRWSDPATWAYTNNPAVMVYNILRGITLPDGDRWGGDSEAGDLPLANWFAAMNECDRVVGGEAQYRAGHEVRVGPGALSGHAPATVIEDLLKVCAGVLAETGGTWRIRCGPPGPPVAVLTDEDIIVTEEQSFDPFEGLSSIFNAVHAQYPEPAERWVNKDAPPRRSDKYEAEDGGHRKVASLQLPACPYPAQAQRLMQAWLKDGRRQRRHSITLPPDFEAVDVLDTVAWTSSRNGYQAKLFEVGAGSSGLRSLLHRVELREVDPSDYDWQSTDLLPSPVAPVRVTPTVAEVLPGWKVAATAVEDSSGRARRAALRLSWDPDIPDARGVAYEVRVTGQTTLAASGSVQQVEDGSVTITEGVIPAASMQARGRLIASRVTLWTDWQAVTTPSASISRAEIDAEVLADVADLEAWAASTGETVTRIQSDLNAINIDVDRVLKAAGTADAAAKAAEGARDKALAGGELALASAAQVFPAPIGDGSTWSQYYAGTPTAIAALPAGAPSGRLSGGVYTVAVSPAAVHRVMSRGVRPWFAGRTIRITAELRTSEVTTSLIRAVVVGLDAGFTVPGNSTVAPPSGVMPTDKETWQTVSRDIVLPALASVVTQFRAGISIDPAAPGARVDVRSVMIEDVTAGAAADSYAKAAAGFASDADAKATEAGQSATAANASAVAAKTAGVNAEGERKLAVAAKEDAKGSAATALEQAGLAVKAKTDAGNFAGAALTSRDQASGFADDARREAAAARDIRLAVDTAKGTAVNASRDAVTASETAETAAAAALKSTTLAARLSGGGGVLSDPLLDTDDWTVNGDKSRVTISPNAIFPTGKTWNMYAVADGVLGMGRRNASDRPLWNGQVNAAAYVVDVEFTRSGPYDGAGVILSWENDAGTGYWASIPLVDMITGGAFSGQTQLASAVFVKPAAFSGTFSGNSIWVFANHAQFGPTLAEKTLRVHRINVRVTTKEELGLGQVAERVQATLTQSYYTKTETGSAIAGALETYDTSITNRLGQKANSSVVQAIDTRVKQTESGLSAVSDSLTQVSAQSDRGTAKGLLRVTSDSGPAGVRSRLVLQVEANGTSTSGAAALYLEARDDGTGGIAAVANRFALVSNTSGAGRTLPFVARDNGVHITNGFVDTLSIADNAVTVPMFFQNTNSFNSSASWTNIFAQTVNIGVGNRANVLSTSSVGWPAGSAFVSNTWYYELVLNGVVVFGTSGRLMHDTMNLSGSAMANSSGNVVIYLRVRTTSNEILVHNQSAMTVLGVKR